MPEPEMVMVRRYQCPYCHRRRASKSAVAQHMERCWLNPAARSCKTCAHYEYYAGSGLSDPCVPGEFCHCDDPAESCGKDVDLTGGLKSGCPLWKLREAA
jgi:hypothetical protein